MAFSGIIFLIILALFLRCWKCEQIGKVNRIQLPGNDCTGKYSALKIKQGANKILRNEKVVKYLKCASPVIYFFERIKNLRVRS